MNSKDNSEISEKQFDLGEFEAIPFNGWKSLVEEELKGVPFDKKLVTRTVEKIDIQPLYTSRPDGVSSEPGESPYRRGTMASGFRRKGWEMGEEISFSSASEMNRKAKRVLAETGRGSLWLHDAAFSALPGRADWASALSGLQGLVIRISASTARKDGFREFAAGMSAANLDGALLEGSVAMNVHALHPIGNAADEMTILAEHVSWAASHFPRCRVLTVSARAASETGGSAVHELAFALASAVECLRELEERGVDPADAAGRLQFLFSTGPHFFMEIAKFRAFRMLWDSVAGECGFSGGAGRAFVCGENAYWNKTRLDPHVNMLRATAETLAMVVGGCDSIRVRAFDETFRAPSEFSSRIARNVQHLLMEESRAHLVIDPGGGSFLIENLTSQLCETAWNLFRKVEGEGGLTRAMASGCLQKEIGTAVAERKKAISRRKDVVVGTSMYVNLAEPPCPCEEGAAEETAMSGLPQFRASSEYERLREKAEAWKRREGSLPRAFLLTMGSKYKARADFSRNFLEPGGFEVVYPEGFENADDALAALAESRACMAVICSTDDDYPDLVPHLAGAIKRHHPSMYLVLAGYPEAYIEAFREAGVDDFIHLKADHTGTLERFHAMPALSKGGAQ